MSGQELVERVKALPTDQRNLSALAEYWCPECDCVHHISIDQVAVVDNPNDVGRGGGPRLKSIILS